jgi:hypothetical protein
LLDDARPLSGSDQPHRAFNLRRGHEVNRIIGQLAPGDVVTVTRTDRRARSTFDRFSIVKRIVDAKAQFRSLAEPWAYTGTSTRCWWYSEASPMLNAI